ncbi:hypothetical protein A2U01_0058371, partial [Trifolium medium]|nr:hypothetical protein [Trifolium medium]
WTRDADHLNVVKNSWSSKRGDTNQKLQSTLKDLHSWGDKRFGVVPKRIKALQRELLQLNEQNGSQNLDSQIRNTEKELDDILECEEMWWAQ